MSIYSDILKKYWGYDGFRPLQEEIIRSVADLGKDTLGLLPTGGGKSIIFQVPALSKSGVCIVITPLIALMKDQVENLCKRNIKAVAIYSGLTAHEINNAFDACIYGDVKFLYMSPERIGTDLFQEKVKQMEVSILAIDEAHCISQWGYDFRPSYLNIIAIRELLPNVPVLALTATATPEVADDIMDKLGFKEKNLFKKSFSRKNLIYIVRKVSDKEQYLLRILNKQPGSGVVYVRNRRRTKEAAEFLQKNRISADYFHAGLTQAYKDYRQEQWKQGRIRIICATNAFGMGIDKSDVRVVVHLDVPDSIEAYFQEAGRGGRDEKKAYAVLLYDDKDIEKLEKNFELAFPPKDYIRNVYNAISNYYQIPIGGARGRSFGFNLFDFCKKYGLEELSAFNALKILQRNGYLEVTDEISTKGKVMFLINREDLYKFQVAQAKFDYFIKILLRQGEGIFGNYVEIDEERLAKTEHCQVEVIYSYMNTMASMKIVSYIPKKYSPYIIYTTERLEEKSLIIKHETYELLKERYEKRIKSIIKYCQNDQMCRSRQLTSYFGEENSEDCCECDICRERKKASAADYNYEQIFNKIYGLLSLREMTAMEISNEFDGINDDYVMEVLENMRKENVVELNVLKFRIANPKES